ncbi:MAG TPA: EF-hand domain-containing protein [Brevundimonas sp.]|uniref:EF-hand domain-containing protein n=1 Tax=Brevundimonas sp. TaxID=1871086 RepID=UPI002DED21BD|nr:EF-hand domain-containing protein [Brevundimonas sp.]
MRAPKKSETLEVRLPFETKTAFMALCRARGRSASDAVRGFIDAELGAGRLKGWPTAVAAAAGLALGAMAAPTLAQADARSDAAFERLDANGDGVVSKAEFAR